MIRDILLPTRELLHIIYLLDSCNEDACFHFTFRNADGQYFPYISAKLHFENLHCNVEWFTKFFAQEILIIVFHRPVRWKGNCRFVFFYEVSVNQAIAM
jgi:hypothetical protein